MELTPLPVFQAAQDGASIFDGLWRRVVVALHHTPRTWPAVPYKKCLTGTWGTIARVDNYLASLNVDLLGVIKGKVGNGSKIRFWVDMRVGDKPLRLVYPNLYELEKKRDAW
uniref:Uncharacterized protein n=1 Tax=Helianthus annuus TaxID=4232 RepID=A0A251SIZ4_HELAN